MSDSDENEEDNSLIKYSFIFGTMKTISNFWDDLEDLGEKELLKYKIIKIKIYTGKYQEQTVIIGVDVTYKNIFTGQILNREHKGKLIILDVKELEMKSGEYLTDFYIRFPEDNCLISELGFGTNKNQNIYLEIKLETIRIVNQTEEEILLLGHMGISKKNGYNRYSLYTKNKIDKILSIWFFHS